MQLKWNESSGNNEKVEAVKKNNLKLKKLLKQHYVLRNKTLRLSSLLASTVIVIRIFKMAKKG